MDAFLQLVAMLQKAEARFVVIGVWGVNYYATSVAQAFSATCKSSTRVWVTPVRGLSVPVL